MIAGPIGVSPVAESDGGWNASAVWNSDRARTGPKVITATSTRCIAMPSEASSSLKTRRPALSSSMCLPFIGHEVSSRSKHGQRGSGLDTRSGWANAMRSLGVVFGPRRNGSGRRTNLPVVAKAKADGPAVPPDEYGQRCHEDGDGPSAPARRRAWPVAAGSQGARAVQRRKAAGVIAGASQPSPRRRQRTVAVATRTMARAAAAQSSSSTAA